MNFQTDNIAPGQSAPVEIKIPETAGKPVFLNFEGPALTADAGALLLKEAGDQLHLIEKLSGVIRDDRDARYVKHKLTDLSIADRVRL